MAAAHEMVTLRVHGEDHAEWKRIEITRSLDSFPPGFSLELATGTAAPVIRADEACEILIGRDLVLTGSVKTVTRTVAGDAKTYSVAGQSKAGTASKNCCTGDPSEFLGLSINQIASALATPFGLAVTPAITGVAQIAKFVPEFGERIYPAIERLCRGTDLLVTDNPAGDLVLTARGSLRGSDLTPENIKRIEVSCSSADRYSEYRVYGQRAGDDMVHGADAAHPWASVLDDDVTDGSLLVLRAEQQADIARCKDRATNEATTRAGRSAVVKITVQGWHDMGVDPPVVLMPNRLRHVIYPDAGVDAELLVTEVTLRISDTDGIISTMTLMPPGAFELLSPMAQKAKKKKITAGFDEWSELDLAGP